MNKKTLTATIILIILTASGVYLYAHNASDAVRDKEALQLSSKEKLEGLVYQDPARRFSFVYPSGFGVSDVSSDGLTTLLVQDPKAEQGVQIHVVPMKGEDIDITVEAIRSSIPDLNIKDAKAVTPLGGRAGLEFTSDNPAFGGASREIWFVWKGNLYQMSTYERYVGLLDKVFEGWRFNRGPEAGQRDNQ